MTMHKTALRVFVSSPRDLKEERNVLEDVISELNLTWSDQLGIILELVKWETHTVPGISTDPQAVINEQIKADFDIFIGVLWTRFGTPTGRASSGTEEEFEKAHAKWKANSDSIRVMFYFKTTPLSPDQIDPEQLARVNKFQEGLGGRGVLYWSYATVDEFSDLLRLHLSRQIQEWAKSRRNNAVTSQTTSVEPIPTEQGLATLSVEDDTGYLDLVELTLTQSERATEVFGDWGQAINSLNNKLNESIKELNAVTGDDRTKLAAYKKISNRIADALVYFTDRMKPLIPVLRESLHGSLDAYGRTVSLMPDFELTKANMETLKQAGQTMADLKSSIGQGQDSIASLRNAIAKLPRVTTQLNHAKREICDTFNLYFSAVEGSFNLIPEIERSIQEILRRANNSDSIM